MSSAEQIFAGQVLARPDIVFETFLTPEHFTEPDAARILQTVAKLRSEGLESDMVTVKQENPQIDAAYLSEATNAAPSSANWKYWEDRVHNEHKARRLRRLLENAQATAAEPVPTATDDALALLEEGLVALSRDAGDNQIVDIGEGEHAYMKLLEERYHRGGELPGLETGFSDLDYALMGLQGERLYYVGARPSFGKSALLLNMALHLAVNKRVPTGFLSLESGVDEIKDRMHACKGGLDSQKLVYGTLTDADFKRVSDAAEHIYKAPLYVYDEANMRLDQLISQARRMVRAYGVQALFIDYLQIINALGESKRERVETASLALKQLSRELKIPVVAAAQLRRESDPWWPDLGDFQHASQAEQDADTAIFIGRKTKGTGDDATDHHHLVVAKNRDGVAGVEIPVVFQKPMLRFLLGTRQDR